MDPNLLRLLEEGNDEDEVAAIVRLGQPGAVPEGVRIVTRFGDIATVRLRRGAIPDVRASAEVASMKPATPLIPEPEVDPPVPPEDLPESFAWVDDRRPRTESATGRGVVVGVIDFGCDFAHPDFRHPDGRTRLLALWDQSARPASGATNRYGYGVIHNAEAINHALETDDPYAALEYHPAASDPEQEGAHGTHVTGIAAGNGRAGGPVGVAPEADLVFVQHSSRFIRKGMHRLGDSVTLLEAVDFIAQTAGEKPWVINISMGSHGGQHDGSTLVEQGLDAALRAAPGRAASQSGGNYYQQRCHTSGRLRKGEERTFTWDIDEADVTSNELEVWYSGRDVFVVELRSPDGALLGRAALGERIPLTFGGREIGNIYHRQYEPNSFDNHIDIFLYPGAPPGDWRVTLVAQDVVDGRFHAWIERDAICQGCQSRFPPEDAVTSTTTGAIANGFRTISVGAYDPHSPDQRVAPFSSCGPTRDDRLKPDVVAPGVNVLAARSAPWDGHDETSLLTRMSGTSMASPHVAGALALMFEAAPRPLRIEETHNLLMASTRKVSAPQEMASRIGSGYLDLDEAVKTVRQSVGTQLQPERPEEEAHAHREETEVAPQVLDQEDFEEDSYYDPTDVTELDLAEAGEEEPTSPEPREPAQPGAPETKESTLTPGPREEIATFSERADRDPDLEYQMEEEELDVDDFDIVREGMADMTDEEISPEEQRSHISQGSTAEDVLTPERTVSDIESSRERGSPLVEDVDPVAEIGEALWKKASTGVSVAIYDPDDAELTRRGVDWAKREDAIGLKAKKIEAAGLTFGKAIADSGDIVRTLTDLGAALKAAVDKVPAPSGTKGTTPSLIRILALFSHGWGTTLAIGGTINKKNAAKIVKGIAPVLTDDVRIVLYGCSVCRGVTEKQSWHTSTMEPGGADSLAAMIRDALVDEGKTKASVWGHTEVGHTTTNWTLRTFYAADGKGAQGKAYAGQFVFGSEKTKALEDLERAIEAEGFRVEASKRADFESFVLEILKAHMYDAYGAANLKRDKKSGQRVNNLTYNGVNLSEMAPVYPNEVAEIIRAYWRDVYWSEERKKTIAKGMIRRLEKLKVIEKAPVPTVEMAAPEVEEQAVAELAELEEQSAPACYQILSGAAGTLPAIGFELDVNYGASKVSPPLKPSDAGWSASVYGLEGKNITTHRMNTDSFRLEGDGNRIEIATKPFELSATGQAEMKKIMKDVLALVTDLSSECRKAKADTSLGFPADVGAPRYFKPSYLETRAKCVFPLALNPKKSYYGEGCAMGAAPQATFTLPLGRIDALVTLIKNSESKKVAGRALSGPSGWRQGKRSQALYNAQNAVKKSRDHHIKTKTKLSNGDVVTQANFTPTLQGLLILMVCYLRTSELAYDHTPNGDWDYEEFAKAYLPLNVKNPFRLLFKDLTADEKRVFKELYDSPRVNLWRLAKDSATAADKDNQLFPARVEGHQKGWFLTAPTWDEFVEKTVTDKPLNRTESGPTKKGEDVGCEVLFAPLSRIIPYESGSRRVTVEMRRLGFNWVLSHGFEKDGVKHPGWAEMTGMLFDMALELNKPAVTSVSPNKGPIKGGQAITIHGTGFLAGTTVKVGGAAATDVVVKDTNTLTAKTPAGTAGRSADVVLTTPAGSARLPGGYAYEAAASKPRGTGASPAELVDLADAAVGAGYGSRSPSALIGEVLSGMGATDPIATNGHDLPSAAEIFDAFAYPGRDGLRQHLEQFLEVVAVPGSRIDHELRPGDLLLERALGEGDLAHLSMLTDGEVLHLRDLESAGLTPESGHSGLYAHVLELGAFPKNAEDRFARRLASESGRLGHDQMILRLRQDVAPFREEQELEEMYGPEEEWESDPAALGAESRFQSAFDQGRTSLIKPEEGWGLPRPSWQPLLSSQECQRQLKGTSVAVVGGGLAGLMAARRLGRHGVKVTVFEARPQVGGRVLSNETFSNGRITEEGAELIGSFHTTWLTLAREPEYGLAMVSRMDKDLYAREGLDVKLTLDKPLSMDEISKLDKDMETRVLEPIARLASQIQHPSEPWLHPLLKQYDNMSVADALVNLYGIKRNERLWKAIEFKLVNDEVAPLEEMNFLGLLCKVRGGQGERLNGTDKPNGKPNLMGYWEELEIFRCADGCQKLAKGIANEIKTKYGAKLLLSRAVTHIDLSKQRVVLGSKEVISGKLADEPPLFTHYDYVILAVPPSVWADVKITADGKDAHPKDKIGLMGMNPAVKFFSDVKERFWIKEKAAPYGGSLTLGQVWEGTDNQTRVGNQGIVLSVFAGPIIPIPLVPGGTGRRAPTPDEFQKELRNLYPGYTKNLNKKPLFSNWPGVPFIKTGYASPRKGEIFTIAQELNKPFLDRLFFAGEHTQMDFFGYMEGALRSGERAAEKLMLQSCGLLQQPAPASSKPPVITASAAPIRAKTAF